MGMEIPQWELVETHNGDQLKPMMGAEIPQWKSMMGTEILQWKLVKTHDGNRNSTMEISLKR